MKHGVNCRENKYQQCQDDQNGRKEMTVIGHFKKYNFYWKISFSHFLIPFHLSTLYGMHSEITSLQFFERSGIAPIHATDSI